MQRISKFITEDFTVRQKEHVFSEVTILPTDPINQTAFSIQDTLIVDTFYDEKAAEELNLNSHLQINDYKTLLAAKSRRHPEYFNGLYIQEDFGIENSVKNLLQVCIKIFNRQEKRSQVICRGYYRYHFYGLEIAVNSQNQLSILALDSTPHAYDLALAIQSLKPKLIELNIPFYFVAVRESIQSDRNNCGLYVYSMLSELAKNPALHEDLLTFEKISHPILKYHGDKIVPINPDLHWISMNSLPLKLTLMTQSYTRMSELLTLRGYSEDEASTLIATHKKKYHYSEDNKRLYYIHNRKQNISKYIRHFVWNRHGGDENLLLNYLSNNEVILLSEVLNTLNPLSSEKAVQNLINTSNYFYSYKRLNFQNNYKDSKFAKTASNLAVLREALIQIILKGGLTSNLKLPNCYLIDTQCSTLLDTLIPNGEITLFRRLVDSLVEDYRNRVYLNPYREDIDCRQRLLNQYGDAAGQLFHLGMHQRIPGYKVGLTAARFIANLTSSNKELFFSSFPDPQSISHHNKVRIFLVKLTPGCRKPNYNEDDFSYSSAEESDSDKEPQNQFTI